MAAATSILWIAGFVLSVVIAPQLRIWTWGPTMLCFALSTLFALPVIWKERANRMDLVIVIIGALLVTWLGIRASISPVAEFAQADTLLVAMSAATFVSFRAIGSNTNAQRILITGIALLTAAHVFVLFQQVSDRTYSPVFANRAGGMPSGFYGHYSYGGSYLVAASFILGAAALHSREKILIRVMLGLVALLAICGIYYTRSRGAIFGAVGGFSVLALYSVIVGKRDKRWWSIPCAFAFPIILIGIGFVLYKGWGSAELARSGNVKDGQLDMMGMLDNAIRFYLINIAVSCFMLHPLLGGGARSFSWECYRFWDLEAMGQGSVKPEHVHNELLQTAVEYGILGVSLLIVFLICAIVAATFRSATGKKSAASPYADAWRIGGLAGFAGLFAHSNFEGIFRIAPGAILLALCLSAACFRSVGQDESPLSRPWLRSGVVSLLGVAAIFLLSVSGWKGTQATRILWPTYFGGGEPGYETRIDALSEAIDIWPLFSLVQQRGILYQQMAADESSPESARSLFELAVADYQRVSELHPFDPASVVASANLLSLFGQNTQAESGYERGIKLQGGMEGGFQAHFNYARHLHRKALAQYDPTNPAAALEIFQMAILHMEEALNTSWAHGNPKDQKLRVKLHEDYARALEAAGKFRQALAEYDFATTKPYGGGSHYNAALLLGRLAVTAWSERRSEDALYFFIWANNRMYSSRQDLPSGVTAEDKREYAAYLLRTINFLKGAKVTPSKKVDF
jgi:O-antigen ligase/tetratricopeptide (TPR) repeat protein